MIATIGDISSMPIGGIIPLNIFRKGLRNMRIENEMVSRFNRESNLEMNSIEMTLSQELDFFFDNVMNTVVDYFKEEVTV